MDIEKTKVMAKRHVSLSEIVMILVDWLDVLIEVIMVYILTNINLIELSYLLEAVSDEFVSEQRKVVIKKIKILFW